MLHDVTGRNAVNPEIVDYDYGVKTSVYVCTCVRYKLIYQLITQLYRESDEWP